MKVNPAHWRWAVDGCYRCMQDTSCTEGNIAAVEVRVLRWRVGIFLGGRRAMIDQDIYMYGARAASKRVPGGTSTVP